jgi:hypothetical protein
MCEKKIIRTKHVALNLVIENIWTTPFQQEARREKQMKHIPLKLTFVNNVGK